MNQHGVAYLFRLFLRGDQAAPVGDTSNLSDLPKVSKSMQQLLEAILGRLPDLGLADKLSEATGTALTDNQIGQSTTNKDSGRSLVVKQRPTDILIPLLESTASASYQSAATLTGLSKKLFAGILSPFNGIWTASKGAAGAWGKGLSAAAQAVSSSADGVPKVSNALRNGPGSIPGKFSVAAAAVVLDSEPELAGKMAESSMMSPQYADLEELYLRSPDQPAQEASGADQQGREQSWEKELPRTRRIRRDPADYLNARPAASRARRMLQLEKDQVPISPTPMVSRPDELVTATSPAGGPKTFRRTLDLPEGFRRALPTRGVQSVTTPAQMAKSRSMANLRKENGVRVRGASSLPPLGSGSTAEVRWPLLVEQPLARCSLQLRIQCTLPSHMVVNQAMPAPHGLLEV
jgi:hypothetical protein